jgi:hypothetical protein
MVQWICPEMSGNGWQIGTDRNIIRAAQMIILKVRLEEITKYFVEARGFLMRSVFVQLFE